MEDFKCLIAMTEYTRKKMDAYQEKLKAKTEAWLGKVKTCLEVTETSLENKEAIPEEAEVTVERLKVRNKDATAEAIGAPKDQSRDQKPAVGC
jgi:hypothetical protein